MRSLRRIVTILKTHLSPLESFQASIHKLEPRLMRVLEEIQNGLVNWVDLNNPLGTMDDHVGNEGAVALAEALKVNSTVTHVDLGCNSIGVEGTIALAEALKVNSTVTIIHLHDNAIGSEGAIALAEALKINSTITLINLRGNTIGAAAAFRLAEALKFKSNAITVTLSGNSIDSETQNLIKRYSKYRIEF
ncbi:hypothetical protein GEMRC1_012673 [Eukaryota sp. GEM-RC1]